MTPIQRRMSSGEISPSLYAGTDLSKYQQGLKTLRNAVVLKHGGTANRPGTEFIALGAGQTTSGFSTAIRLVPFILADDTSYVVVFSDARARFLKNGVEILAGVPKNITGITQASPAVVTSNLHGYSTGEFIKIYNVQGMVEINERVLKIGTTTANTFQLLNEDGTNFDTTNFTTYTSGGTFDEIYSVSSPYTDDQLSDLQYVQGPDSLILTHVSHPVYELKYISDTSWTLADAGLSTYGGVGRGSLSINSITQIGTAGSTTYNYVVTAVLDTGEEVGGFDNFLATTAGNATLSTTNYNRVTRGTFNDGTGSAIVVGYNVYRQKDDGTDDDLYFVGSFTSGTIFNDVGFTADRTRPVPRTPWPDAATFPNAQQFRTSTYSKQRQFFAAAEDEQDVVYGSQIGYPFNFGRKPASDDSKGLKFRMLGLRAHRIHYMRDIGNLVIFTNAGEFVAEGDAGVLTPTAINLKQYSYNGSALNLPPIVIDNTALYVQARGAVIRDLLYNFDSASYRGNDLTTFSSHLVERKTLVEWAYQQTPNSIVWIVRDDGQVIALTYIRDQQILGWHRHDFQDGLVKGVCTVPEGDEDAVYFVIQRFVEGTQRFVIERMSVRNPVPVRAGTLPTSVENQVKQNYREIFEASEQKFLDCSLTYDGRIAENSTNTFEITGGSTWEAGEAVNLESLGSYNFSSADVGQQYHVWDIDKNVLRLTVTAFVDTENVTVTANRDIPSSFQGTTLYIAAKAVNTLNGLWHLEDQDVAIYADGFVVASPNNPAYPTYTVQNGSITLDKHYAVIHVGLPYNSDIQTLSIDSEQGESIIDKNKLVTSVTVQVQETKGMWAGSDDPGDESLTDLTEFKMRDMEGYDVPVNRRTGVVEVNIDSNWNQNGQVFIRQVDPAPMSVLAIAPSGLYPFGGGR